MTETNELNTHTSAPPFIYDPPSGDLEILHKDDDILVVNKPAGLLSVPGKAAEHRDCLETRLRETDEQIRTVHRLDMATSGVMVFACNAKAHRHLGLQFERRHVKKRYVAKVWGIVEPDNGEIDLPLRCDWPNRPLQIVDHDQGRKALTHYEVLERQDKATVVALYPQTGRSHQLRVHMLELGHPILGDRFYAYGEALVASERLLLHAEKLELFHPADGRTCVFEVSASF